MHFALYLVVSIRDLVLGRKNFSQKVADNLILQKLLKTLKCTIYFSREQPLQFKNKKGPDPATQKFIYSLCTFYFLNINDIDPDGLL